MTLPQVASVYCLSIEKEKLQNWIFLFPRFLRCIVSLSYFHGARIYITTVIRS